jgi:hypothetical protein
MSARARLAWILFVVLLILGCARTAPQSDATPSDKPIPTSVAQAGEMKRGGTVWENGEVRAAYLRMIATIAPANEKWKQENVPAEERARRAFQIRHDARMTARAMMKDAGEVAMLQKRDQEKYGNPDGPTFEMLVDHEKKKGLTGDAVYEAIVASSQRTDMVVNELFGLH